MTTICNRLAGAIFLAVVRRAGLLEDGVHGFGAARQDWPQLATVDHFGGAGAGVAGQAGDLLDRRSAG